MIVFVVLPKAFSYWFALKLLRVYMHRKQHWKFCRLKAYRCQVEMPEFILQLCFSERLMKMIMRSVKASMIISLGK